MKVLVTGAAGYIGSVACVDLLEQGHQVVGLDRLDFGGESLTSLLGHPAFKFQIGDIRDSHLLNRLMADVDGIVHLAAIVGDPACAAAPNEATQVNLHGTKSLLTAAAEQARQLRFIFASTCSNYGRMSDANSFVNEESELNPVSLYAQLKVTCEELVLSQNEIEGVALRFATAHGLSPRMRYDLTVNEFVRDVALGRELQIYGKQFWRPYCHVRDIARAIRLALVAPAETVAGEVFGVGDTSENFTKEQLSEHLTELSPNADIVFVPKDEDPRDYRVNFDKISKTLGFQCEFGVRHSMQQLFDLLGANYFHHPLSSRHTNTGLSVTQAGG